jgi:hypothetical protein
VLPVVDLAWATGTIHETVRGAAMTADKWVSLVLKDDSLALVNSSNEMGQMFDLAKVLSELAPSGIHAKHGYPNFWAMVEDLNVGGSRKARYLIDIYERLKALKYTESQMRDLFDDFGWSNLKDIAKHLKKRIAVPTLRKKYLNLANAELRGKLRGSNRKVFTADLPLAKYNKLIRLLKKKYGLEAKGKGQGRVAEAFAKMIDVAYHKL